MGGTNKRIHLVKTGQEVIWNKGFDRSSIKDITEAAGLPKGSFYHYFSSKEQFAVEAMNDYVDSSKEQSDGAVSLSTLEELIDRRIAAITMEGFAKECYMSVMCHAFNDQNEAFRTAILDAIKRSNEAVHHMLLSLREQGLIDQSLEIDELLEYVDFSWRGARLKARMLKSVKPLQLFKRYLFDKILKS